MKKDHHQKSNCDEENGNKEKGYRQKSACPAKSRSTEKDRDEKDGDKEDHGAQKGSNTEEGKLISPFDSHASCIETVCPAPLRFTGSGIPEHEH